VRTAVIITTIIIMDTVTRTVTADMQQCNHTQSLRTDRNPTTLVQDQRVGTDQVPTLCSQSTMR
jgi:hypothetical protein